MFNALIEPLLAMYQHWLDELLFTKHHNVDIEPHLNIIFIQDFGLGGTCSMYK